jgi:two-component system, OmpR family, sensor histidine kinase QseC
MTGSLRLRLIGGTLALVAAIWLAATAVAWFETRHEAEEILDAHLAQAATLLAAFVGKEADEIDEHLPSHRYLRRVTFQVWEKGRELAVHSANAPDRRLSEKDEGYADAEVDGRRWRVFSLWNDKRRYLVQVGETREARSHIATELAKHLALPLAVALPLLALGLALIIGRGLAPLSQLAEDVGRRDAARLDPIDATNAPRELQPLLDRLNQLFGRVAASLEQERRFTADAAHELRTPLAAMRTHAQVALGATSAADREAALARVIEATDRTTHLLEQLLTLARLDANAAGAAFTTIDLRQVAAEAVALATPAALDKQIDLALDDGPAAATRGDAALIGMLLRNLLDNALRYSPEGAGVGVTVATPAEGHPFIAVCDDGPGIPATERRRALERFYRVPGCGETGSGLGLSIATRIAELHGARLELADGPAGKGLCARVVFLGPVNG